MRLIVLALYLFAATAVASNESQMRAQFIKSAVEKYEMSPSELSAMLDQAQYQQSIVDAMSRPAEKRKTWGEYRKIFLTDARITAGKAFLDQHAEQIFSVSAQTGVPAEFIVAIIGVETSYGRITGSYRVLDALYTLSFHYPKSGEPETVAYETRRAAFFQDELAQFLLLSKENGLDPAIVKGSYAGAMGFGQFMPSSWRAYGVDGDGDGRRDLINSLPDAFASIANYFVAHGWRPGKEIYVEAQLEPGFNAISFDATRPHRGLAALAAIGYRPVKALGHDAHSAALSLEGEAGPVHFLVFNNFYVVTRYNRSPMYALAVTQLAQSLDPLNTPMQSLVIDSAGTVN